MTEAEQLIEEYDGPLRPQALELAENVVFMARKLKETRESMGKTPLIVRYNNGGGQAGYRENPVFKAYNAHMKTYLAALESLNQLTGAHNESQAEPIEKPTQPPKSKLDEARGSKYKRFHVA